VISSSNQQTDASNIVFHWLPFTHSGKSFISGNRQKSEMAKSAVYGGYRSTSSTSYIKNSYQKSNLKAQWPRAMFNYN
jgi:hypothetical protein